MSWYWLPAAMAINGVIYMAVATVWRLVAARNARRSARWLEERGSMRGARHGRDLRSTVR